MSGRSMARLIRIVTLSIFAFGERVEIDLTNNTSMAHPMHLHGHDFEVQKVDGEKISGALRDTIVVPPGSKITVAFEADNPGIWAFHCHLIYHLVSGMFTVLHTTGRPPILATGKASIRTQKSSRASHYTRGLARRLISTP